MTAEQRPDKAEPQPVVSLLRAELREFAGELHGPVRGIRTRAGGVAVEGEGQPTTVHAPRAVPGPPLAALPAAPATNGTAPAAPAAVEAPAAGADDGERTVVIS